MTNRMSTIDIDTLPAALAADLEGVFPHLVRMVQDDVFSGALRMTGNRADAEDITQEALVRAYRALSGYPAARIRDLRVRGWVWTIAANLCRNRARSRARKPEAGLPDGMPIADTAPGPEQMVMALDGGERLAAQVATLPWAQREAVVLRHVVGLGYAEIAAALDRPVGTVKADVHRALAKLREMVQPEEAR